MKIIPTVLTIVVPLTLAWAVVSGVVGCDHPIIVHPFETSHERLIRESDEATAALKLALDERREREMKEAYAQDTERTSRMRSN